MIFQFNGNQLSAEKKLVEKIRYMVNRMKHGDDNHILIDGDEGMGKSNLAALIAALFSHLTGRSLSLDNLFFDLDKLINFAINTKEQIIIWDEGALGGLASEWWRKNQRKFLKLVMVARKKQHFMIICIPKFFKLNEYLVVDRSIALLHVYARNNIQKGRFIYYNKRAKEGLYDKWKRTRKRNYKMFMSFGGSFVKALPKVFDEREYERKKDEAILSIQDDEKISKAQEQLIKLKYMIATWGITTGTEKAKHFGVGKATMSDWGKLNEKYPNVIGVDG